MAEYIYSADPIGEGQYHHILIGELVRCGECVHSDEDEHNYCNKHMFWTGGSDFFCRDGERKADDE